MLGGLGGVGSRGGLAGVEGGGGLGSSAALSVLGRSAATPGIPADIVATADGQFLGRVAGVLAFSAPLFPNIQSGRIARGTGGELVGTTELLYDSSGLGPYFQVRPTSAPGGIATLAQFYNDSAVAGSGGKISLESAPGGTGDLVWATRATSASVIFSAGIDYSTLTYVLAAAGTLGTTADCLQVSPAGNVAIGAAALATTATDGFLYVTTCPGIPTGAPTAITGRAPIVVDSTNNLLNFYSGGGWRALSAGGATSLTASVASATTITLPETGLLVPITGSTQIDYISKPTGNAPRKVTLWLKAAVTIRHEMTGAGGGAAPISIVTAAPPTTVYNFAVDSFIPLIFDGAVWRRENYGPHWDGVAIIGAYASAACRLDSGSGAVLSFAGAGNELRITSATATITSPAFITSARIKLTKGSVAAASNIAIPANCPLVLVTGTGQTINTFTSTGWSEGMIQWLKFDGANTLTDNSGGANDFVARTPGNITTAAGMVLAFVHDGVDLREIGR